ncbi:MAG TPA: SHOCT domain-containing protein [Natrialbaceae archaeon]|nr:SHOCT domain-containing protein [Natrialbaceae archaeon]
MSQTSNSDSLLRIVIIIAVILVVGPFVLMLLAAPFMGGMMMLGLPGAGGFAFFGVFLMLLFPLLLIAAGVVLYRQWNDREREDAAMQELRMAFARGDIDREEFEERRDALLQGERRPSEDQWDEPPADDRWEESSSEDESRPGQP